MQKTRFCKSLVLVLLMVFSTLPVFAQGKIISGTVKDGSGVPIVGATILEKGNASNGTATDLDGNFSFSVSARGNTLVVSYIGMKPREIPIDNKTTFQIQLEEGSVALDEIVMIGYGTQRKRDLTGTVTSLSGKELAKIPTASTAQAITGRMAGVQITTTDGSPDAEMVIRVRGGNSVTGDNSPLYIVDGFPVSSLNDVSPTDIQSIDILKDASSTAIYGSQGANGVVLITTKGAEAGKTKVSYNTFFQTKQLARRMEVLDPYEYVMFNYEYAALRGLDSDDMKSFVNRFGVYGDLDLYKYQQATDWQDDMFGAKQLSQQQNISITGGTQVTKFALSGTFNNDGGLMVNNDYSRTNLNFKLNHEISSKLKFEFNTRITDTEINGSGTSGGTYKIRSTQAVTSAPVKGLADMTEPDLTGMTDEEKQEYLEGSMTLAEQAAEYWKRRNNRIFNLTGALTWEAIKNLYVRVEGGYDFSFNDTKNYWGPTTTQSGNEGSNLPLVDWEKYDAGRYRVANTFTYTFKPGLNHSVDVLLGQEYQSTEGSNNYIKAKYFPENLTPEKIFANLSLSTGTNNLSTSSRVNTPIRKASFFGRVNYSLLDKYLFSAIFRADGSSKFAKGNRWGYFPAASAAWRMKDEGFMQDFDNLSTLKLRVSYGESGNDNIGSALYKLDYKISSNSSNTSGKPYGLKNILNSYYTPTNTQLANPMLKWETTSTANVGLDFGFFNDAITGIFDIYKNVTRDLLITSAISAPGYTSQQQNVGQTSSKGFELTLDATLVNKKDFNMLFNFNIGVNRSNVDALAKGLTEQSYNSGWAGTDIKGQDDYRVFIGQPVGVIWGFVTDGFYSADDFESYDAIRGTYTLKEGQPTTGLYGGVIGIRPGALKLKDISGPNGAPDGVIDANYDREIIGNTTPKHTGGFGLTTQYKSFDFILNFNWVYGNQIYNANKIALTQNYRTSFTNLLATMSSENRYSYLAEDGTIVTDLSVLKEMNETGENKKNIWSPHTFGSASVVPHSWAIEDGSYLRLQTVTMGYTVPKNISKRIGISSLRVYCTLNNVFCWTNYTGYDPEVSTLIRNSSYSGLTPGVDYSSFPKSFSTTFGLNLTF